MSKDWYLNLGRVAYEIFNSGIVFLILLFLALFIGVADVGIGSRYIRVGSFGGPILCSVVAILLLGHAQGRGKKGESREGRSASG